MYMSAKSTHDEARAPRPPPPLDPPGPYKEEQNLILTNKLEHILFFYSLSCTV